MSGRILITSNQHPSCRFFLVVHVLNARSNEAINPRTERPIRRSRSAFAQKESFSPQGRNSFPFSTYKRAQKNVLFSSRLPIGWPNGSAVLSARHFVCKVDGRSSLAGVKRVNGGTKRGSGAAVKYALWFDGRCHNVNYPLDPHFISLRSSGTLLFVRERARATSRSVREGFGYTRKWCSFRWSTDRFPCRSTTNRFVRF